MSPVRTAARVPAGSISRVFSSNRVLPEPGELIKFSASVPLSRHASRSRAAIRSFSLKTFFSIATLVIFDLFHFQIRELKLVAAGAPRDVQRQPVGQRFETESERLRIDARELANQDSDCSGPLSRMKPRLLGNGFQNRTRDAHFVHQQILGSCSPASMSTMRVDPKAVFMVTIPALLLPTVPTIRLSLPRGSRRIAARISSAAWGATIASSLPSLATYSGSRPSNSHAPLTSSRTGMHVSSIWMLTLDCAAISFSALDTPPRVGSRRQRIASVAQDAASMAATRL